MKVNAPGESSVGLCQYTANVYKSLILNPVVANVQHSKGSVVLEQHWQVSSTITRETIAEQQWNQTKLMLNSFLIKDGRSFPLHVYSNTVCVCFAQAWKTTPFL